LKGREGTGVVIIAREALALVIVMWVELRRFWLNLGNIVL
jgi:hypothetical protein